MTDAYDPTRRKVMIALAALPLHGTAGESGEAQRIGSRTLVVYFSRSGNTRVVAGLIQRALNTDLFEIRPASAYPKDYLQTVEQARQERDAGYEPKLEASISDMQHYHTVLLGFPVWGESTPAVIRSFLTLHDLSGKTLIPFITHGGYGLGNSLSVLASHAPKARLIKGFVMQADQERQTMNSVNSWLSEANLKG